VVFGVLIQFRLLCFILIPPKAFSGSLFSPEWPGTTLAEPPPSPSGRSPVWNVSQPSSPPTIPYSQVRTASSDATPVEMHPLVAHFIPTGRLGAGGWFLRNLAQTLFCGILIAPFKDSGDAWEMLVVLAWVYLTIVRVGKRLHDLNISAWFSPLVCIPPVPLLLIFSGTNGINKYGFQPSYWKLFPDRSAKRS
jgi:hypothetical protein